MGDAESGFLQLFESTILHIGFHDVMDERKEDNQSVAQGKAWIGPDNRMDWSSWYFGSSEVRLKEGDNKFTCSTVKFEPSPTISCSLWSSLASVDFPWGLL